MGIFESKYEEQDLDVRKAESIIEEQGVVAAQELIQKKLEGWKNVTIKIGITGNAGVGKSTFINAFRGIDHESENSAVTGVVEATEAPKAYPYPDNPNITLMDLPGIGTPTYPDLNTYCEKVGLESYDTFLILTATRFTQFELELAQKIKEMGKSFFLVRTKLALDEMNEKRKRNHNIEEMEKKIREYCQESIKIFKASKDDIFLIDNFEPSNWEFPRLLNAILAKLPTHQKEALTLSLRMKSKESVRRKVEVLKGRAWMVMLLFIPAVPLDIFSKNFFSHTINWAEFGRRMVEYRYNLGLPEEDSEAFQKNNDKLQKELKECYAKGRENFWRRYSACVGGAPIVSTAKKAFETSSCLKQVLDEMQEMAFKLLDEPATHNTDEVMEQ